MTRNDLRNAYNSTNPTPEQKKRMLNAILNEAPRKAADKYEYTGKPAGTRWWTAIPAAAALIAVVLTGLILISHLGNKDVVDPTNLALSASGETEGTNGEPDDTESATGEDNEQQLAYAPLLELYIRAFRENWDPEKCNEANISYMVSYFDSMDQIGYCLIDLDGDGIDELIISDGNVILDLYTLTDSGTKQILSGWERNSYQLCEGNFIANVGSGSAFNTVYNFYRWNGLELEVYDFIIFDASLDENAPWFGGFRTTQESARPLTEAEAQSVIASYVKIPIEIKALDDRG